MTIENLINIVRIGRQLTPAQSRAVVAQLERIPAMERTLAEKDKDFTQLSIAYTAAVAARQAKGVQFTAEECGYVDSALAECDRLKEAVRWMLETMDTKHAVVSYASYKSAIRGLDGAGSLSSVRSAARMAVEELL